jgi:hypothetical protein
MRFVDTEIQHMFWVTKRWRESLSTTVRYNCPLETQEVTYEGLILLNLAQ